MTIDANILLQYKKYKAYANIVQERLFQSYPQSERGLNIDGILSAYLGTVTPDISQDIIRTNIESLVTNQFNRQYLD